ncbi:MAG TPA: hypothetical protein DCZ01_01225 [Elusimicrobia bacterium]|nr:MAG: hypothetical protein A2X37_00715 [Elusimicrobia bacterium GWA2_66_18]OGR76080.1 MAG: hypothetical protein A2X40_06325 [Elusimicrobia bacterium GWC2_65_9]HAZ07154.1 hypothetical protein [Elusimicrobiota bacterium]
MKLFDDVERTFTGHARRSETTFNFLNRSARPDFAATRDAVEALFADFPESAKADVRARFRSPNEAHSGAFFELFLHAVLRKSGYEVALHPSAGAPNTRRVDFQIEANGKSLFIEARTLTTPQETSLRERLLAPILDAIDEIESPDFFLHVEIEGNLQKAIAIAPIKKYLVAWLKSLDYDKVKAETSGEGGHRNCPTTKWEQAGCILEFTAWPKGTARGKPGRAIGMEFGGVFWNNTGQRLRKILSAKARRYGKMNTPYIIAVNVLDGFMDDECALEALYGQEAVQFRTYTNGRRESQAIRQLNGLWRQHSGPRYTRVSAVLIVSRLRPWCMPQSRLTLYMNPWAEFPLSDEFSALEVVRLGTDGHLARIGKTELPPTLCPALLTNQA